MKIIELQNELNSMSVSPSQKLVAVGGRSLLKLYSIINQGTVMDLSFEKDLSNKSITDLAMNPVFENVLVTANTERVVQIWDLVSSSGRNLVTLDRGAVTRISWQISDPNTLLIGATDGLLRVADVRSQDPIRTIMDPKARQIRDCQFYPHDNCTLAACFDNGTLVTFDSRSPRTYATKLFVHDGAASCLAYHPFRRGILACGGYAGIPTQLGQAYKLKILTPDREVQTLRPIRVPGVRAICWRNGSEIAASLDSKYDHSILLWNIDDPFQLPKCKFSGSHREQVNQFSFISDEGRDDYLISVGSDGDMVLQDFASSESCVTKHGRSICWSHNNLAISDDPIQENSGKRGAAKVFLYKSEDEIQLELMCCGYKSKGFENLESNCQWNSQIAKKAGSEYAAGFWQSIVTLFSVEINDIPLEQRDENLNHSKVHEVGDESTQSINGTLLKDIRSIDKSISKYFVARSNIPAFHQLANELVVVISEKPVTNPRKDEPHVHFLEVEAKMTTKPFNKVQCLVESLDALVDKVGDLLTAITCLLVFHNFGYSSLISRSKAKRWFWALSDLLQRSNLSSESLEIARISSKFCSLSDEEFETRIGMGCSHCGEPLPSLNLSGQCPSCKKIVSKCIVCRLLVSGRYSSCLNCGHGGHPIHMQEWFIENEACPSGCGCQCVFSSQ